MKLLTHLLAAAIFMVMPTAANAADWWIITDSNVDVHFADASTFSIQAGRPVFWFRVDYLTARPDKIAYEMRRIEFDCVDRSLNVRSQLEYNKRGDVIHTKPASGSIFPPPESTGMNVLEFGCNYSEADAADGKIGKAVRLQAGVTPEELVAPYIESGR